MKLKEADLILERLNEGQNISENEDPELIQFLQETELVEVYNKNVLLTSKGKFAAGMGIKDYLKYHETEKELLDFTLEKSQKRGRILLLAFFLLFILFFVFLFTNPDFLSILQKLNFSQTFGRLSLL